MASKRRARRRTQQEAPVDYGPSIHRRRDGRLDALIGASKVVVGNRIYVDPDTGREYTVAGARRHYGLDDYDIPKPLYDACERFLIDCSAAHGHAPLSVRLSGRSTSGTAVPDKQLQAITRVNQVWKSMSWVEGRVLWIVVFNNISIREAERLVGIRHGTGLAVLLRALRIIEAFYQHHGSGRE